MTSNEKFLDQAANIASRVRLVRRSGHLDGDKALIESQIDELARAITELALYLAERDQVRLTQP